MANKVDATTEEKRAWRVETTFLRLFLWPTLLICIVATIFAGFWGASIILNGIRDWWHYREGSGSPDFFVFLVVFVVAGAGWFYVSGKLTEITNPRRFDRFVVERRRAKAKEEEERLREKTAWDKFKKAVFICWLFFMATMLLTLFIRNFL